MPKSITIGEILDKEHYVQVTGDEKALERPIYVAEINRPGFELAGFFKHSDFRRIIIFGDKESAFINEMSEERQREIFPFLIKPKWRNFSISSRLCPTVTWQQPGVPDSL